MIDEKDLVLVRIAQDIEGKMNGAGRSFTPMSCGYSSKPEWDYDLEWNPSPTQMARFKARDLELAQRNERTLAKHHPRSSPYQDTLHSLATVKAATRPSPGQESP